MSARDYTQEEVTRGLMAVVAWAGNVAAAHRHLKERGLEVSYAQLRNWTLDMHREQYEELREKYADQMEKQIAHEYRDVAARAVALQKVALDKAEKRLLNGDDHDPSKTAMHLSRVSHTAVEKLMTLTNRPEKVLDKRTPEEVVRRLYAMGIFTQLPAGSQTHEPDPPDDA